MKLPEAKLRKIIRKAHRQERWESNLVPGQHNRRQTKPKYRPKYQLWKARAQQGHTTNEIRFFINGACNE